MTRLIEVIYKEIGLELTRLLERFGYTYSVAKVLSILILSPSPLSMNDIKRLTGLSLGSVSMALKRLEHEGLLVYIKKGRTKFFKLIRGLPHILKIVISKILLVDELRSIERKSEELISSGYYYLKSLLKDIRHLREFVEE